MSVQDQKPTWAIEFKIDDSTWDSLLRDSIAQNCPPLALAFERGLVNELLYIKQQQKVFEVSALNGDFFNAAPPAGCFEGYDLNTCKKEGTLPIGQWDNQTLFAKIHGEKTDFEEKTLNCVFLLAPWSAMKKWFLIWEKSNSVLDSPQGLNIKTSAPTDALSNISFGSIKIDPQDIAPKPKEDQTSTQFENIKIEQPNVEPEPVTKPFSEIKLDLEVAPLPAPVQTAPPPTPQLPPIPKVNGLPPLPPMAQKITAYPNIPLPDLNNAMAPEITSITKITSLENLGGPIGAIPPLPLEQVVGRAQFVQNYDDLCTVIFGCWKNFFDKTVIFKFNNAKFSSPRWDGTWATPDFRKNLEIDVSRPSIFKIVANSEHPYHGYVVSNDVNKKFFDECNKGEIPEFVNICPLFINKQLVGAVMGVCSQSKARTFSLNQIESHGHLFSEQLLRLTKPTAKAS